MIAFSLSRHFFPAVDGGGSFLITAGLPGALFLFFTRNKQNTPQ